MLLAGRISLSVLKKEAAKARAKADRLFAEAKAEKARAFRALAVAFGVDTELPSTNHGAVQPQLMLEAPENMAPEISTANTDMVMTPSENVAPESNV
ncbi:hypothetical protein E2562_015131 [Oryza meyeriana var. granulata]|uniref:Uncharacterized protein n=1 Tax=Oryza meyeriana var. granulata TaxID=110450 RepID=A0A6G1DXM2_9ORYZ|nr:hypothetical protein E2562_015131 [Oryza meyeriana var. granulata]